MRPISGVVLNVAVLAELFKTHTTSTLKDSPLCKREFRGRSRVNVSLVNLNVWGTVSSCNLPISVIFGVNLESKAPAVLLTSATGGGPPGIGTMVYVGLGVGVIVGIGLGVDVGVEEGLGGGLGVGLGLGGVVEDGRGEAEGLALGRGDTEG
jgi:hypothetical protein